MNTGKTDCRCVSRRVVLTGTAVMLSSAAAAILVPQAEAQQKMSQESVKYQGAPMGEKRCDSCTNFQAPKACKIVQGDISPSGWCQYFAPKST
jgi:hypothetical protein